MGYILLCKSEPQHECMQRYSEKKEKEKQANGHKVTPAF